MKIVELTRYGIPDEIIRLWREGESEELLPLQEMAVRRHNLFDGRNLLIQAPTSSGKTFIGEMAAIQSALRRKKVVYLVPLKALAEEKFDDFRRKYGDYGIEVIISTRDRREFDSQFESGNFSIAVAVYEKLAQLLVRRPERLEEVELIVADELELLSDPDRGPQIELLLTRVLRGKRRVIGLSAVLGHAERLAQWMEADLVLHERRPLELRYGVLFEGRFSYRTYNEYSQAEERLAECHGESVWDVLAANVCAFAARGESCLVFVKAKHEARRGAQLLAQALDLPPAAGATDALRKLEPTHSRDCLIETLGSGIAFHNADLSRDERRVVEHAFRSGEVRVIVSTSTLAVGMNLPAHNVFIASEKWQYDDRFGVPWKTPILRSEYENMGGRAGRFGSGVPFGRSILVATTPYDRETLWRRYIEGERERVEPRLGRGPIEDHILRLVAARVCADEDELHAFLDSTLTGRWIWPESHTVDQIRFHTRAALNRAIDAGVIQAGESGILAATPFGHAAAAKGVAIATARDLAHWVRESETRIWSELDLMLAAALTPDGRALQVALTSREYERSDYPGALKRLTLGEDLSADVPLNRLRRCAQIPFFEEVRAIKIALFLLEWIDERPVYEMEERYHTLLGQILAAAEQISWLIDAAAAIATACGAAAPFVDRIQQLAERVQFGLRADAVPLARLRLPGLDRPAISALETQGLHTAQALADTPPQLIAQWVPTNTAHELTAWARRTIGSPQATAGREVRPSASLPVLIVDDRRPGQITLDGMPIRLQEKQYRLVRVLARSPGECVSYDLVYKAVWGDAIVEPNQMHFQKRRLIERIREAVPRRADLIRTVPKRGFMLDMDPRDVAVLITSSINAA